MQLSGPKRAIVMVVLLLGWLAAASWAGSAKILLYHHVAEDTPRSTSVSPRSFDSHMRLLEDEGYRVVRLQQIIAALVAGDTIDSRWVAITFDDGYRSVLTAAAPRLKKRGWPFTVFVNSDYADQGQGEYLGWEELRRLEKMGATIGNHSRAHDHLVWRRADEDHDAWQGRVAADIIHAQQRLEAELENPARVFSYPYGEFDSALSGLMTSLGFVSLGQQSGPVGVGTNPYAIPRFPLGTGFDDVRSVAEKLRTEYLPLIDPPVPATILGEDALPPTLRLRVDTESARVSQLNCFVNGQPNAAVRWTDAETGELEVVAERTLRAGRSRYTCTAPVAGRSGVYYWHTHLWIKPLAEGSWYSE
ncbi:MAG: polysaccharide deacetylase family protein [Gammaproteobacteria bacterium]|nr:polysaccharide deacetylase family protein [Gammaproteobacteria bacterium]